jgi:CRP-like cAMP-binding protein
MSSPEMVLAAEAAARRMRTEPQARQRPSSQTVALLAEVPLFAELSTRRVRRIARLAREASFAPGRMIVQSGVRGDAFYVIIDGSAKVYRAVVPSGRAIAKLGPGDFFGEMALLDGGPRTATVMADSRVVAVKIARPSFRQLLLKEPSVAVGILETMARRARSREPVTTQ